MNINKCCKVIVPLAGWFASESDSGRAGNLGLVRVEGPIPALSP